MQAGFTPLVPFSGVPSAVKQAAATKRDVWLDPVLAPSLALAPAMGEGRKARGERLELKNPDAANGVPRLCSGADEHPGPSAALRIHKSAMSAESQPNNR